jgi:DNA-binding XRE family transcriptional regulator
MATGKATTALRARRLECGLTQSELATRAGVSRQLVAAVESGQNAPAVDAALRLAGALATTVEELFAATASTVFPALGAPLRDGTLVRVGAVGDRLVAASLPDHGIAGAAWARPDGIVDGGGAHLFPGASPREFVLAGCDPALGVAETMLEGLGPSSLLAAFAPTGLALTGANVLKGTAVRRSSGSLVRITGGGELHSSMPAEGEVRIAVHPWALELTDPGASALTDTVVSVRPDRGSLVIRLTRFTVRVDSNGHAPLAKGSTVGLRAAPDDVRVLTPPQG